MKNMILILGLICAHLFGATTTPPSLETTQSPNLILAGPTTGGAAIPTFRSLVAADFGSKIIASMAITSGAAANNTVLTADGAGNAAWVAVAGGGGAPTGAAGGSLSGNYPNPNLAATIGDAVNFTGNYKINGVAIFVNSVKPTPFNYGDLWYETKVSGAGIWWQYYNGGGAGNLWISVQEQTQCLNFTTVTLNQIVYLNWDTNQSAYTSVIFTGAAINAFVQTTNNSTNYWQFNAAATTSNLGSSTNVMGANTGGNTVATFTDISQGSAGLIDSLIDPVLKITWTKSGTGAAPGALAYNLVIKYKWVHP